MNEVASLIACTKKIIYTRKEKMLSLKVFTERTMRKRKARGRKCEKSSRIKIQIFISVKYFLLAESENL